MTGGSYGYLILVLNISEKCFSRMYKDGTKCTKMYKDGIAEQIDRTNIINLSFKCSLLIPPENIRKPKVREFTICAEEITLNRNAACVLSLNIDFSCQISKIEYTSLKNFLFRASMWLFWGSKKGNHSS